MAGATVAAVDTSDIIFLVTSRDVARLLSAKSLIKFLKTDRQVTNQKLKVLVNEAEIGAEISESEIESLLEHPVAAYLPCNAGPVTFSINSGAPIVIAEPHHPISVVLNKLAELSYYRWQDKPSRGSEEYEERSAGGKDLGKGRRQVDRRVKCYKQEERLLWPSPPPAFNRPMAPVPGAIPRPGAVPRTPGVPARTPAGIPPRPGAQVQPATQALPTLATPSSAMHASQEWRGNGQHQQRQAPAPARLRPRNLSCSSRNSCCPTWCSSSTRNCSSGATKPLSSTGSRSWSMNA